MVFSFFKKQAEKMPDRPAAKPRPPAPRPEMAAPKPGVETAKPLAEPLPDLEFSVGNMPAPKPVVPPVANQVTGAVKPADDLDFTEEDFDRDFSESSVMAIDVDFGGDPLQADIEQVVVLFANGQDAAARGLLETYIKSYTGPEGRRFWALLFDLLQAIDDRAAFEKLGEAFSAQYETSPPTWQLPKSKVDLVTAVGGGLLLSLQGVLTADGAQPLAELSKFVAQKQAITVDCGKLVGCDDEVSAQLADLLSKARRGRLPVTLANVDNLISRMNERLVVCEAVHLPAWLLLLELLQRHGTQEAFEERAVDYAVTFELSPPSWETPVAGGAKAPAGARDVKPRDDAHYLAGDLKNARFDDLDEVLKMLDHPVLDFSAVRRMDFFSAGQLVNRLAPYKRAGRDIVIRSPNSLVAELMAIVGLNKQARIIIPKS
jgi:anti-anti-sigma regulatory factor